MRLPLWLKLTPLVLVPCTCCWFGCFHWRTVEAPEPLNARLFITVPGVNNPDCLALEETVDGATELSLYCAEGDNGPPQPISSEKIQVLDPTEMKKLGIGRTSTTYARTDHYSSYLVLYRTLNGVVWVSKEYLVDFDNGPSNRYLCRLGADGRLNDCVYQERGPLSR